MTTASRMFFLGMVLERGRRLRVVDRRMALERDEKEHFRKLMRMQEQFTGCRALAYCVMGNHFHILLEVPPRPEAGLSVESLDLKSSISNPLPTPR